MSYTDEFVYIENRRSLRLKLTNQGIWLEKYRPIYNHYAKVDKDIFLLMIDNIKFCIENEEYLLEYDEDNYIDSFMFYLPTFKYTLSIYENGLYLYTDKVHFTSVPKVIFSKNKIIGHLNDLLNGT